MVFQLRIRASSGMKRLVFPSNKSTWLDVQQQISDICAISIDQQLLSRSPLHQPNYILTNEQTTLEQLRLNNGDILYLAGESSPTASSSSSSASSSSSDPSRSSSSSSPSPPGVFPASKSHIPPHTLTPNCNHGPRGGCPYCLGIKPGETIDEGVCNHPSSAVCIHCSSYIKSGVKDAATWLCNHPDTVFCPKCIPPSTSADDLHSLTMSCNCDASKGQECIKCVKKAPVIKIDKIPFSRYLADKQSMCKFKHGANVTCAFCAPPPFPSFAAKPNCDRGHAPYPAAVCLNCAPPNAILRVQPYRHVDSISVESKLLAPFYSSWLRSDTSKQRAAMLFGRYVPEPAETKNPGAIRAQVHAIYEPPQESKSGVGFKFLKDEREKTVHVVAERLGLECVGWVITTNPRLGGEKYGGKILMSGFEVEQAARLQLRYSNSTGYSRFVTLILEQSTQVEPVAYQVADMAVALEKEHVFAPSSDPYLLSTKVPAKHQLLPTIVYKDRPLPPGESFLPDELLVKVIVSAPKGSLTMFQHHEFSSSGGELLIKTYMQEYNKQEYEQRLSDFNLLVNLVKVVGDQVILQVCDALKEGRPLTAKGKSQLDSILLEKNLL